MTVSIHPTAVVEKGAKLGDGVVVGPHSFVEAGAVIGADCEIRSNAFVSKYVRMGRENIIHHGAAIGGPPQDLKFGGEYSELIIGDRNVFRECTTMNRGTKASGKSVIGSDCLFMAYTHVAHDCLVGDHVILANCSGLGGHVTIGDWAILGGSNPIHQFVTIGEHAMIGMCSRITQDVPHYVLVAGQPTKTAGINSIGLRRRGFSDTEISAIKKCYRIVFRSGLGKNDAIEKIEAEVEQIPPVVKFVEFLRNSERGILQ